MSTKLNVKQWALASFIVFVILTIFRILSHSLREYLWPIAVTIGLPETEPNAINSRIAIYFSRLILAMLFTYIFAKTTNEGKSSMGHGLRYGFGMGLIMFVPDFVSGLVFSNFSISGQTTLMVIAVLQFVVCGAAIAKLYVPNKSETT